MRPQASSLSAAEQRGHMLCCSSVAALLQLCCSCGEARPHALSALSPAKTALCSAVMPSPGSRALRSAPCCTSACASEQARLSAHSAILCVLLYQKRTSDASKEVGTLLHQCRAAAEPALQSKRACRSIAPLRQYLYFCTIKASKLRTPSRPRARGAH